MINMIAVEPSGQSAEVDGRLDSVSIRFVAN